MDLSSFFNSYPGFYIVQSFFHSVISVLVVEIAIKAWRIQNPTVRQRFLFIVIFFPLISFPLFQFLNPRRTSLYFRLDALLDTSRWVNMDLWGIVPVRYGFLLVFGLTAVIFLFQELVPILRHTLESRRPGPAGERARENPLLSRTLEEMPFGETDIFVLEDEEALLFSTTGKKGSIYVSSGLLQVLSREQVRAAVAHEFAHVVRGRRPFLVIAFLFRVFLFYNPVVLMEFRRIVQEDEKICDDLAVSLTDDPTALAGALKTLYITDEEWKPGRTKKSIVDDMEELEYYSHRLNIESRIARLEKGYADSGGSEWFAWVAALATVLAITYYVV